MYQGLSSVDYLIIIILVVAVFILFGLLLFRTGFSHVESEEKRAGRLGEKFATGVIREILNDDDVLLTNVEISIEEKNTELDNVIISSRGVFIIEVKNYSGELAGDEDDHDWIKNKITPSGNFYQKKVRNPINQVKRQIYILSKYLKQYGIDVWIMGYVFMVERNSPVESEYILESRRDIDDVLHFGTDNNLTAIQKHKIVELLSD